MTTKKPLRYQFTHDGKRYSVTAKTQKELIERVQRKKEEVAKNNKITRNLSVTAWLAEWIDTYKKGNVTDKTYNDYKSILRAVNLSMPVKNVRPIHLQQIMNSRAGYSYSYLKKLNILLKEAFESAKMNNLAADNPAANLVVPRGTRGTHRAITGEERALLIRAVQQSPARVYVLLLLLCGLRPHEACIVRGCDVDTDKMRIHVRGTKSAAADRFVPLPFPLLRDLSALGQNEFAVKNTKGGQCSKDARRYLWRTVCANMERLSGKPIATDFTAYCLRHTYATDLQAAGVPINVARDLLGHSDISVTSKIYTHRSDDAFNSAAAKMGTYQNDKMIDAVNQ